MHPKCISCEYAPSVGYDTLSVYFCCCFTNRVLVPPVYARACEFACRDLQVAIIAMNILVLYPLYEVYEKYVP
jgi:hypothetical protein